METQTTHTPTPWFVQTDAHVVKVDGKLVRNGSNFSIWSKNPTRPDNEIAVARYCNPQSGNDEQRKANAAFIVRAVNAHEALVEAARAVLIEWATPLVTGESLSLQKLESALALAEGR